MRNTIIALCLTVFLYGGSLPAGLALCVGVDGHVAFEAFDPSGGCEEPGSVSLSLLDSGDSHCGDCLDVTSDLRAGSTISRYVFIVYAVSSLFALEQRFDAVLPAAHRFVLSTSSRYPSAFLRSTILLI